MADSIENQIRELADLSLVQQRFVSDVSHELRTPLTTIQLAAEVLYGDRDDFDPIAARSAELLHDQVGRFEQLLTDLLEISRYDAGSVELEREETSLSGVAEQVAESMRQVAWQNDTEVRFRGADGDDVIPMDPRRIPPHPAQSRRKRDRAQREPAGLHHGRAERHGRLGRRARPGPRHAARARRARLRPLLAGGSVAAAHPRRHGARPRDRPRRRAAPRRCDRRVVGDRRRHALRGDASARAPVRAGGRASHRRAARRRAAIRVLRVLRSVTYC